MNDYEMARPNEATLIEMAESGIISWEKIAIMALGYMDDAEIGRLTEKEGLTEIIEMAGM